MKKLLFSVTAILLFYISGHAQGVTQQPHVGYYAPPAGLPRNIIIFIAPGMGMNEISAATIKNKGSLNLFQYRYTGFIKPWTENETSLKPNITLNALSTGLILRNDMTGLDGYGKPVKTLVELAKDQHMSTGMVVTSSAVADLPSSLFINKFASHNAEQRALDLLDVQPDMVFAGGKKYFDKRSDKRELLKEFYAKGYDVVEHQRKIGKISADKILALVGDDDLYGVKTRGDFLEKASFNAAQMMTGHAYGYLLIVANDHISKANKQNDVNYMADEVVDLDKAIGALYQRCGNDKETLMLVIGTPSDGQLAVTGSDLKKGSLQGSWVGKDPSGGLIPIFANGPGAEQFSGIYNITDIYKKISDLLTSR